MGYRRIFTKSPQLTLGIESEKEKAQIIDRKSFFIRLAQQSETLRRELIEGSVFGHTGSQIQQKVEDQAAVNVATFAFEFFDEDGKQVGSSYFFGHQDESKIQEPFFFLSGRKHKDYQAPCGYAWDGLLEDSPKSDQASFYENLQKMKKANKYFPKTEASFIRESFRLDVESLEQKWLMYMKDIYSRPGGVFFRSLIARQETINKERDFCRYYATHATKIESINLPTPKGMAKGKMGSCVCNDDKGVDKSGDFLHSEQFGLFKMRENQGLETFITWVKECVKKTVPDGGKPIAQAVLLLYTRSAMCIRCSTATIFDFFGGKADDGSRKSFKEIIEKGLFVSDPINAGILVVASNYLGSSNLVEKDPMDNFERHMRGEFLSLERDITMGEMNRPTIDSSAKIFHSFLKKNALSRHCQFVLQTQNLENSAENRRFVGEVLQRRDESPHSLFKVAKDLIIRLNKKKILQKDVSLKGALNQLIKEATFLHLHKRNKLKQLCHDAGFVF